MSPWLIIPVVLIKIVTMGLFVGQDFNLTGKTAARWLVCCCLNQNHEFRWSLATLHATVTPCITFFDWLSCFSFTILVATGRAIMSLWMGNLPVHELYTAACGLYFIWLVCRLCVVAMSWVPLGIRGMAEKVGNWIFLVRKHMHKNWITNIFASPHESQSLLQECFPRFSPHVSSLRKNQLLLNSDLISWRPFQFGCKIWGKTFATYCNLYNIA